MQSNVINYLNSSNYSQYSLFFSFHAINQMMTYPSLQLDIQASANSPHNIDRTAILDTTPEGKKFNSIYKKINGSLPI